MREMNGLLQSYSMHWPRSGWLKIGLPSSAENICDIYEPSLFASQFLDDDIGLSCGHIFGIEAKACALMYIRTLFPHQNHGL